LNALIGIVSTPAAAPIIVGSRLCKGAAGSPRGAGKFVGDVLTTVRRLRSQAASGLVLLRADSAFYGHAVVYAAHRAGAKVSITARTDPAVKRTIATVPDDAWTTIDYSNAIRDEATGTWISSAGVAEIPFTANAAWLVLATIAFNLSRAVGSLTDTDLSKARSGTIRRKLIQAPARISTSARRIMLHLPASWPWETGWQTLFAVACGPPQAATI
jgi:hypothetical protein